MGRRDGGIADSTVAVLLALVVFTMSANAQIYTCWGGCYNECFLRSSKTRPERLGCYYQCLSNCVPRSPSDYRHYCQIGCSLERCASLRYSDGASVEKCFGRCSNLCKS